jgi:hypothetical protein
VQFSHIQKQLARHDPGTIDRRTIGKKMRSRKKKCIKSASCSGIAKEIQHSEGISESLNPFTSTTSYSLPFVASQDYKNPICYRHVKLQH